MLFRSKINNYLAKITSKDESLFTSSGIIFIEGVDFHHVWKSSNCNAANKQAIWKYLQILMILGRKIIPNHQEIIELLKKISNGQVSIPAKVEKTLETPEKDEEEPASDSSFGIGNLLNLATNLTGSGTGSEGGLAGLGNLASTLGN